MLETNLTVDRCRDGPFCAREYEDGSHVKCLDVSVTLLAHNGSIDATYIVV